MNNSTQLSQIANQLLQQENHQYESEYKEYRMKLETALTATERRERLTGHLVWMSFLVAFVLMFVGGSKVFGPFDPTEEGANYVSIALSLVYVVAAIIFPISLASYLSRFRPQSVSARSKLREANQLVVRTELAELRQKIARLAQHQQAESSHP